MRKAINIVWANAEGEEGLPESAVIPDEIAENEVASYLSEKYGWCVRSYSLEEGTEDEQNGETLHGCTATKRNDIKMTDLQFEKIKNYDPLNSRADKSGMVSEWVARNAWGNAVAFGYTKAECIKDARNYISRQD